MTATYDRSFAQVYRPAPNPTVELFKRVAAGDPPTNWQLHNVLGETIRGLNREERRLRPKMTREDKIIIDDVKDLLRSAQHLIDEKNRDEQIQRAMIHGFEASKQASRTPMSLLGFSFGAVPSGRLQSETRRVLTSLRRALWKLVQHPEFQVHFREFWNLLYDIVFYDQETGQLRKGAVPLKKALQGRKGLRSGASEALSALKDATVQYGTKLKQRGKQMLKPTVLGGAPIGGQPRPRHMRGGRRFRPQSAMPPYEQYYEEYMPLEGAFETDIAGGRGPAFEGREQPHSDTWENPNAPPAPPLPQWGPEAFRETPLSQLIGGRPATHWKQHGDKWERESGEPRGRRGLVGGGAEDMPQQFGAGEYYDYFPYEPTGEFVEEFEPYYGGEEDYGGEEYYGREMPEFGFGFGDAMSPMFRQKAAELAYRLREMIKVVGRMDDYKVIVDSIFAMLDAIKSATSSLTGAAVPKDKRTQFHFNEALAAMKSLIESFAGAPLDPLINNIRSINEMLKTDLDSQAFFADLKQFLTFSLENPERVDDPEYRQFANELVMRGMKLSKSGNYRDSLLGAIKEATLLFGRLASDSSLRGFYNKLDKLVRDVTMDEYGRVRPNTHALRLLREMAIPIIIQQLRYVPLPRIDGTSRELDYWADHMVLLGKDITPDSIKIEMKTAKDLNVNRMASEKSGTKLKITISNVSFYIQNIHFWFNRKVFPRLTDEGIGHADVLGTGDVIKITLVNDEHFGRPWNFRLLKTTVKFDTVRFRVDQSLRHKGLINFGASLMKGKFRNTVNTKVAEALLDIVTKINAVFNNVVASALAAEKATLGVRRRAKGVLGMLIPNPTAEDLGKRASRSYEDYNYGTAYEE